MTLKVGMPIGHRPMVNYFSDISSEWKIAAQQVRFGDTLGWEWFCSLSDSDMIRRLIQPPSITKPATTPRLSACQGMLGAGKQQQRVLYVRLHPHYRWS